MTGVPTSSSSLSSPSHSGLHSGVIDAKHMYGATGNGSTDDTAALQAAITAAQNTTTGNGAVFLQSGNYRITSALTLDGGSIRIYGPVGGAISESTAGNPGAAIVGNFAGSLLHRTLSGANDPEPVIIIEDLILDNFHASGKGVTLGAVGPGTGIYRCSIEAHEGIVWAGNNFGVMVSDSYIHRQGTSAIAGSVGISLSGHGHVHNCDVAGWSQGLYVNGLGCSIVGGRYEVNQTGIYATGSASFSASGMSMEANDTCMTFSGTGTAHVSGVRMHGTTGSPAGQSAIGFDFGACGQITISGCAETGSHATAYVRVQNVSPIDALTFIDCSGTIWSILNGYAGVQIINCAGTDDVVRSPVIATASLPAAASGQDGRTIIEDGGAGDRNLIIYGGGQRFRIDGGAAF